MKKISIKDIFTKNENDFDIKIIKDIKLICKFFNFEENSHIELLQLILFSLKLNNNNKYFKVNNSGKIVLKNKFLFFKRHIDIKLINTIMQNNFFDHVKLFNFINIAIKPINNSKKINIIKKYSKNLNDCFKKLGIYKILQTKEQDINFILNVFEQNQNSKITIRLYGSNHIILDTMVRQLDIFLHKLNKNHNINKYKNRINIELLGQTGINNYYKEDNKSEIEIMKQKTKYLKDLGWNIIIIPTEGIVGTIKTIKTANKNKNIYNNEEYFFHFLCPNTLNRQKINIIENLIQSKEKLKKDNKNIQNIKEYIYKHNYFDNCGGYIKLEKDLLEKEQQLKLEIDNKTYINIKNIINNNFSFKKEKEEINKIKKDLLNQSIKLTEKMDEIYAINKFLQLKESNIFCEIAKQNNSKINIQKIINKQYKNNNYIFLN